MEIVVPVMLGGYVGDCVVEGQWFRPETEREEKLSAEIRRIASGEWIEAAAREIADIPYFIDGRVETVLAILRGHRDGVTAQED